MTTPTMHQENSLPMTDNTPLVKPSARFANLPIYVFAELDQLKAKARARGADLIDLGMGNPDRPTPQPIVDAIAESVHNPENHRYPSFDGKPAFREAIASWMKRRYNADINPNGEVQPLIGAKEGVAHLAFAYTDNDSYTISNCPYYPVHSRATILAGGKVYHALMTEENNYLPDPEKLPKDVVERAKLYIVNYPHNPTAATAPLEYYEKLVDFCRKNKIILMSDLAYGEICFDGYRPPSVMSIPGAKDVAIEFHSFSKTFNMAGWRIGFAVGGSQVIQALYNIKANCDYGVSNVIQDGATFALNHGEEFLPEIISGYQERRDLVIEGFREMGWNIPLPKATMYVWFPVPKSFKNSRSWCEYLIDTCDVVITPGIAFGEAGERYFRVSLVSPKETLKKAMDRMKAKGIRYE